MKTLLRFLAFGLAAHTTTASRCRLGSAHKSADSSLSLLSSLSSLYSVSSLADLTTTETLSGTTTVFSTRTTTVTLSRVDSSQISSLASPTGSSSLPAAYLKNAFSTSRLSSMLVRPSSSSPTVASASPSSACSSNLLVNGDFSSDLSVGWTTAGDGVFESLPDECTSPDGNCADFSAGSGTSSISQTLSLQTGQNYTLSTIWWQPEQTGPGIVTCTVPGTALRLGYFTSHWGTYTGSFVAQSDSVDFTCSILSNFSTSAVGFSAMSVVLAC